MNKSGFLKVGALIVVMTFNLTGCSTFSTQAAAEQKVTADQKKPGLYLPTVEMGKSFTFPTSPWGDNVTATIQKTYYSATHRQCLTLILAEETNINQKQHALVCRLSDNVWEPVRYFAS